MVTVKSRKAHKNNKRVWRININGQYRWFDSIAKAYQYCHPTYKAARAK